MAKLVDIFGRIFGTKPAPEHRERVVSAGPRDWPDLGSTLGNVTPANLRSIFEDADNGMIGRQVELAQTIRERDDHLRSVDQTRRLAVCGLEYVIEPGDDSDRAIQAADAFRSVWDEIGEDLVGRMMDAILEQWHVEEIIWDSDGRLDGKRFWRPASLETVDGRKLCWPYHYGATAEESVAPRIQRNWSISDTIELTPGKFLIHNYSAIRGRPGRGSLVRCVASLWMFKRFSLIDLTSLIEQWGRPWPCLKYDATATADQVQAWIDSLADSMADRVLAVPTGSELEVKPAGAAGADTPHINLIELCNRGMSKAMVGSTTIAEAAGEGKNVSSPTHADVRADIRNADAKAIAASIRNSLILPFTLWNFGEAVAAPKIRPNLAPKPDPASRASVYEAASRLGLKVNSKQVYSELSIEKPEDVDEVIQLSAISGQLSVGAPAGMPGLAGQPATAAPDAATEAAADVAAVGTTQEAEVLPELVLNGAQIQAAVAIVTAVASGELPRDAGLGQLQVLFNLTPEQAEMIMGSAGTSTPTTPNPRPAAEEPTGPGGMPQRVEEKVEGDKPEPGQKKEVPQGSGQSSVVSDQSDTDT